MRFSDRLETALPEMRAFARSLAKNVSDADDLVQEACLKAWQARGSFDPSREFRPWVFRILRNTFYESHRKTKRFVACEDDFFETLLVQKCELETHSDMQRMVQAIHRLSEDQRDAFILIVAVGMTYDEASQVCETTAGTIKSRVSRAREAVIADFHSNLPLLPLSAGRASEVAPATLESLLQTVPNVRGPLRNAA